MQMGSRRTSWREGHEEGVHLVVGGPGAQQPPAADLPQVHSAGGAPAGAVGAVQGAGQRQDRLRRVAALQHLVLPQEALWGEWVL